MIGIRFRNPKRKACLGFFLQQQHTNPRHYSERAKVLSLRQSSRPSESNTATIRLRSCGIASKEAMKRHIKIYVWHARECCVDLAQTPDSLTDIKAPAVECS
jgi:hypothetical protein